MLKKGFLLSLIILMVSLLISCNNKAEKLDRQNGLQGLVLGDSSYTSFIKKVRSDTYGVVKRKLLGKTIVPLTKIKNLDHRFIYGVLMTSLHGAALNGKIYTYSLTNHDVDSVSQRKILDSLKANYGKPTLTKDSTRVFKNGTLHAQRKIWRGNKIELTYLFGAVGESKISELQLTDMSAENTMNRISNRIDAMSKNSSVRLESLSTIGNFDLETTKEKLLAKDILEVDKNKISNNFSSTNFRINYSQYLESFLGIKNKKLSFQEEKLIQDELKFDNQTDSLNNLTISFNSNDVTYSDLITILGKKFGKYSFEEKVESRTNEMYRRAYWLSKDLIIELTKEFYHPEIRIYVNKKPYSLYF